MRIRRFTAAIGAIMSIFVAAGCFAQAYPSKPIRIISPYSAGGLGDTLPRVVANAMTESLGVNVVVENMPVLDGLKYKVEHAVFELVLGGLKGQIAFTANGTVKISGQVAPKLVSLVEEDLHLFV